MTLEQMMEAARQSLPTQSKQYIDKNMAISARLQDLLDEREWTQKELAQHLDRKESQVSRWFSGLANLTLRSITELEVALGADIITVPGTAHEAVKTYITLRVEGGGLRQAEVEQGLRLEPRQQNVRNSFYTFAA